MSAAIIETNRKTRQAREGKSKPDLVCFSHLRWNFVYQRPQHLLSRFARDRRVFFFEEPIFSNGSMRLDCSESDSNVHVIVPHLPEGLNSEVARNTVLREMVDRVFRERGINDFVAWYYTPMALEFTDHLHPSVVVYDCMDELSAFKGAHGKLKEYENELLSRADMVFTGGQSLFEAKKDKHQSVYAFPSSIDREHFNRARSIEVEPSDQRDIPHPRLGFFGVLDERLDIELLRGIAESRPDWNIVLVGPVVKIDPATLPALPNVHYLGKKDYRELPDYIAGWDIALLPFAMNESTRFISPTKTPEYLAAGKPVVSTPIADVVRPYGELGLVRIAQDTSEFIRGIAETLAENDRGDWLTHVDAFLARTSWDDTWKRMSDLIEDVTKTQRLSASAVAMSSVASSPLTRPTV